MRRQFVPFLAVVMLLSACGQVATPTVVVPTATAFVLPTATVASSPTPTKAATPTATKILPTSTPLATATPSYPPEGRGPDNFAAGVDPLTGLAVKDPTTLQRRPIVIKVENIPREHRPQWGLSLADIVYEYYTEFGATRFAAVFYGSNADRVGPIRSGRFFDATVVQMYKSILVYGSAYVDVNNRFFSSNFARRLILETNQSCPALCRYEPNGQNLLVANTTAMNDYLKKRGVDNTPQNLDGMLFKAQPPEGGEATKTVYVRYSGAIYNRWDYDPATGSYLRFSDKQNDVNRTDEVYAQLTDRLTNQPISAQNVVTLCVPHRYYVKTAESEVLEILMGTDVPSYVACDGQTYKGGTGPAYIARDGKIYKVLWKHAANDKVLTLVNADGTPFPFKPGQTWFEVIGANSSVKQQADGAWRFTHVMPGQ